MAFQLRSFTIALVLSIGGLLPVAAETSAADAQAQKAQAAIGGLQSSCTSDADCAPIPEIWSACNHFCGTYKFDPPCDKSMRLCPSFNRTLKEPIQVNCATNAPCRRPAKVRCVERVCTSLD